MAGISTVLPPSSSPFSPTTPLDRQLPAGHAGGGLAAQRVLGGKPKRRLKAVEKLEARSEATVSTAKASRYLQQLCKHFSQKITVAFDAVKGRADPAGRLGEPAGTPGAS